MKYVKFRVREEIFRIIKFIEWKLLLEGRKREEIRHLADEIINYSLTKIKKKRIEINSPYHGKERQSLGFTLKDGTNKLLVEIQEKLNLFAGELVEACVFLYFVEHFSEEDIKLNKMQNWNYEFVNYKIKRRRKK